MYTLKTVVPAVRNGLADVELPDYSHLDGVTVKETVVKSFDKIYIDDHAYNVVREHGHTNTSIEKLEKSFSAGVGTFVPPPAIILRKGHENLEKPYELVYGFGRVTALQNLGMKEWFFTLLEVDERAMLDVRLYENEAFHKDVNKEADIVRVMVSKIELGHIRNDEDAIRNEILRICPHKDATVVGRVVSNVVAHTGAFVRYATYNETKVQRWLDDHSSDSYAIGGAFDAKRDMYGFILGEGTGQASIPKTIMSAAKKFAQTGKKSYALAHVKVPGKTQNIYEKRRRLSDSLTEHLNMLQKVYNSKEEFLHIEGFLPQESVSEDWKKLVKLP